MTKAAVLVVTVCLAATHVLAGGVDRVVQQRHNEPPVYVKVDLAYPTSENSALMQSPCRPERDGYFGGTSASNGGSISQLQYGFRLETAATVTSDTISQALAMVREYVTDVVVSTTFPSVCGIRNILETTPTTATTGMTGITGFRFGLEYDALEACTASSDSSSYCGIFVGSLDVYGIDISDDVLAALLVLVVQPLPVMADRLQSFGILSLTASPSHCSIDKNHHENSSGTNDPTANASRRNSTHRSAQFGLVVLGFVILGGITVVMRFLWMDHAAGVRSDKCNDDDDLYSCPKPKVVTVVAESHGGVVAARDTGRRRHWTPRCFLLGRTDDDCDVTYVSGATSVYSANSSIHTTFRQGNARDQHPQELHYGLRHHESLLFTEECDDIRPRVVERNHHCDENDHLDSIFIVEPDEEELDDPESMSHWQAREYGSDSLSLVALHHEML